MSATGKQAEYEVRLLRVLAHIHDHVDGDLSLDALADVACMSRFHWHRVFRAMTGETLADAVRRILATKVLLGTLGCLPACDRFFIDGFKKSGQKYSYLNARFVERVVGFCTERGSELRKEQARIEKLAGMRYPLMKLVDMYFWQIGYDTALRQPGGDPDMLD